MGANMEKNIRKKCIQAVNEALNEAEYLIRKDERMEITGRILDFMEETQDIGAIKLFILELYEK